MIQLTEITNKNGIIAKVFSPDGVKPAANISHASAKTVTLDPLQVSNYLDSLDKENDKAILLGVWPKGTEWQEFDIVVDSDPSKNPDKGVIARTTGFFEYCNSGNVSLMLCDFDSDASDAERQQFLADLDEVLADCLINGDKICRWSRPSSSATVMIDGKTGNGLHVFLAVKNARPELLELLHRWAWLHDYGNKRHKVTSAAIVLPVSILDPAVKGPERIIYTSQAVVHGQLEHERIDRTCSYSPGGIIDAELAINLLSELTVDFKSRWASHKLAVASSPEVTAARKDFLKAKSAELQANGHSKFAASTIAKALSDRILLSSDQLTRTDGTAVKIIDILLDRDQWIDETHFVDPIKQNIGRNVAQIKGDDNALILHSFSHGGLIYQLKFSYEDLLDWINNTPERELAHTFRSYIAQVHASDIEVEELAKAAAKRLGLSITAARSDAKKAMKQVQETPEITTDSEINLEPDATHYQLTSAYLAGRDARAYGDGLFVWKQGGTIWEKQSLQRVIDELGSRFGHASLCRTASHYKQIASLVITNPNINVEHWPRKYGVPCVDGFWEVVEAGNLASPSPTPAMVGGVQCIPYRKDLGCRWKLKIKPDFAMKTPLFDRVIANVENPLLFQQLVGLLISGYLHKLQKVAVFFGEGGSGKGTTNDIITALLPRGKRTGISLTDMNNPERLMPLVDSAINIVPEIKKSSRPIDLTGLKMLTGDGIIAGRQLYVGMVHFSPSCCHVLNMNDWPMLSSSGAEIERRMGETIVRFHKRNEEAVIGLAEQVIRHELPGVLAWAIEGIRIFFENGLDSERSLELFSDWSRSFDPVTAFVDECCTLCRLREGSELRADLWSAFQKFCEEAKYGVVPGKYEFFGELTSKYKCEEGRAGTTNKGRGRSGVLMKGILMNEDGRRLGR